MCLSDSLGQARVDVQAVNLGDVGSKIRIMGRSGIPLRELAVFEGVWVNSPSVGKAELEPIRFKLLSVNGIRIHSSVLFVPMSIRIVSKSGEVLRFKLDDRLIFRGYEDWTVLPPPEGYFKFTGTSVQVPPYFSLSQLAGVKEQ